MQKHLRWLEIRRRLAEQLQHLPVLREGEVMDEDRYFLTQDRSIPEVQEIVQFDLVDDSYLAYVLGIHDTGKYTELVYSTRRKSSGYTPPHLTTKILDIIYYRTLENLTEPS